MTTLLLAPPVCNYHVSCVDNRCNVEQHACCESLDSVAFWLASNDYEWDGRGFYRLHGSNLLYARILKGGACGPAMTVEEVRDSILPHFAHELTAA